MDAHNEHAHEGVNYDGIVGPAVALGFAVFIFAISFGVSCVNAGGSVPKAMAMSLLVFTGASQFSVVSVIAAGGTAVSAVVGALLLGSRNAIYGVAVAPWLPGSLKYRVAAAHFTIDETTGMTLVQNSPERKRRAFWVTAASIYGFWNVGTLIGALVGNSFDTQKYGLDVAFPAAFVAMVAPLLATRKAQLAGIGGAVVCLATTPFLPIGAPIVMSAVVALIALVPAQRKSRNS
jgi:4-azaleucine resistance transporter AzlC